MGKLYVGVDTEVPVYTTQTINITASNISTYFDVYNENQAYYFVGNGSTFTSNNKGVQNSTAETWLIPKQDILSMSFSYRYSTEAGHDVFSCVYGDYYGVEEATWIEQMVSGNGTGSYTLTNLSGTNLSDSNPHILAFWFAKDASDSFGSGCDDECAFYNMTITIGTQTGTTWQGIARQVKKMYVGVGGKARKVKKLYVGVGGKARKVFGGELSYYGTATSLSASVNAPAGASLGNYAIFAGGSGLLSKTNVYDSSLTRSLVDPLQFSRTHLAGTSIGNYALFGGGNSSSSRYPDVDAYNTSLTRSTPGEVLSASRSALAATPVGNYALFAGGFPSDSSWSDAVDAYSSSLTRTTATSLSIARGELAAASVGNYALFAGGQKSGLPSATSWVDSYNTSLTRSSATSLTNAAYNLAAASIGSYAFFGGGGSSSGFFADVAAYNTSLTKSAPTALPYGVQYPFGGATENWAVFAGGWGPSGNTIRSDAVAYDDSLTQMTPSSLGSNQYQGGSATAGSYILFAGGSSTTSTTNKVSTVYAYQES